MTEFPRPRWGRLYTRFFPDHTDPASRWVKQIACKLRDRRDPMHRLVAQYDTPERLAEAMEVTVIALWKARAEIARLKVAQEKRAGGRRAPGRRVGHG